MATYWVRASPMVGVDCMHRSLCACTRITQCQAAIACDLQTVLKTRRRYCPEVDISVKIVPGGDVRGAVQVFEDSRWRRTSVTMTGR